MKRLEIFILFIFALNAQDNFEEEILAQHNILRAKHGVPPLTWNAEIADFAEDWAKTNASKNKMYHRQPNKYGENIYWKSGGTVSGEEAVDAWYSEIQYYNYSKHGFSMKTGHFTQVVWKDSTEVGCGRAKSSRGGTYVVCNYNPPGNYLGRFPENVPPVQTSNNNKNTDEFDYIGERKK